MLRHYYINKEWIVSETARTVYRTAAGLSIAFLLLLFELLMQPETIAWSPWLFEALLLIGVFSTATTMVAMEYYLFAFDPSPAYKKAFWFCVMLLPTPGAALYCYSVYSRGVKKELKVHVASTAA